MVDPLAIPGDEYVFKEGKTTFPMRLLCKTADRFWFSNGMSFPQDFGGVTPTGVTDGTFSVSGGIWPTFCQAALVGNLTSLSPGDMVLIFDETHSNVSLDVLAIKDSDRKMFVTALGRILSFVENLVMPAGFSMEPENIKLSDDASNFIHQLYS